MYYFLFKQNQINLFNAIYWKMYILNNFSFWKKKNINYKYRKKLIFNIDTNTLLIRYSLLLLNIDTILLFFNILIFGLRHHNITIITITNNNSKNLKQKKKLKENGSYKLRLNKKEMWLFRRKLIKLYC